MSFLSSLFGGSARMDRNAYNAKVSQIIQNDFGITPDSRVDPRFPGVLAYLEHIDRVYHSNGQPEQAALQIMIMLFSGLRKSESAKDHTDADVLFEKIRKNMRLYLSSGAMSQEMYDGFCAVIKKHTGRVV